MHFAADGRLHFVSTPFCLDVPQASTVALYFCHSEAVSPQVPSSPYSRCHPQPPDPTAHSAPRMPLQRWEYTAQRQLLNTFDLLCLAAEDVKGSGVPWLSLRPCAAGRCLPFPHCRAPAVARRSAALFLTLAAPHYPQRRVSSGTFCVLAPFRPSAS